METITHREMRNRSGEILRRVETGESFEVTNSGQPAALIVPPNNNLFDELIRLGAARPAMADISTLASIERTKSQQTSKQIIDEVRGTWA